MTEPAKKQKLEPTAVEAEDDGFLPAQDVLRVRFVASAADLDDAAAAHAPEYALCFDDGPRGLARRQHAASVGALDALVFIAKRGGPSECSAGARYALRAISSGCPKRWDAARKAGAPAAWLGEHCPHAEAMATADVYGAWQ